jgi:cytoskeletal protein CcmA (bactofilin family)
MKILRNLLLGIIIVFGFLFFINTAKAQAPTFSPRPNGQRNIILPQSETVNRNYYAAGDSVVLSGTVNGDVYVAGGNVIIEGVVNGDVLVAGGNITIRGRVTNDVRAIGGNITVSGQTGGSVSMVGGNLNVPNGGRIGGSLVAAGGNLEVFGPVTLSIDAAAGQITVGTVVGRDITATAGQLTITSRSEVNGGLYYWSNMQADIQQGASIIGPIVFHELPKEFDTRPERDATRYFSGAALFLAFMSLVSRFILGLILLALLPVFVKTMVNTIREKPGKSILFGLIAMILVPIIFIILFITAVGIPIALILMAIFWILWYLAPIFVALFIGEKIVKKINGWALLVGLLIYELLKFIPVLGWLIGLVVAMWGLGAFLIREREMYGEYRNKELI